ncbi:MAG: AAA family ATPase [Candidatus Diapherotrites archaeon]|nr:AAA family ATPase [Candidatus Diapherotrites archaeon]
MAENQNVILKQNLAELKAKEFITARELLTTPLPPQEWRIEGLLSDEGVDMLVGKAKEFKSFVALFMACSCATGRQFLNRGTKKCRVLYHDEENGERRVATRLGKLVAGMQLSPSEIEDIYNNMMFISMKGLVLTTPEGKARLEKVIKEVKPDLVIMDSIVRVMQGNENSAEDVRRVFHAAKELFTKYNCSFLLLHHTVKSTDSVQPRDARGSGDFAAMVGNMLILSKIKEEDYIAEYKLEVGLQRDNDGLNQGLKFMVRDDLINGKNAVVIELINTYTPSCESVTPPKVHEKLENEIIDWVKKNKRNTLTTEDITREFRAYSQSAREKALTGLCKRGILTRTTKGHYVVVHPFSPFTT